MHCSRRCPPSAPMKSRTCRCRKDRRNETYEIGSTAPSIRNSSSSIDNEYENAPNPARDSNYGEYIVPMENVPDQGLDSPRANPSSDNGFYIDMESKRLQESPSPEFYQNPDPPPRPCLSRGYVNVSQENVSQDHSSTTALPSSGIIKHESVQTKPLGSQQPVGSKRPDPIGAENGEVKEPQDTRRYKRQESDGAKIQEDRLKVPKQAISAKTAVMDKCVKPVVAVKPGGGNGVKINPKLKNIASKFDETAKSNGAVGQKESLLTMHSWDKTPTPQSPRKDSTTAGQGDSDEDSDIDYENVNDYQNTPSKQVEPRRSPAGAPRNLKAHPDIHNREQRQIIGNKQKKGPAVGR
ncbi:uncharacterized protein LOC112566331 [Pomacea canaliculata]|uniref:uncharacterized protein LOC112566331 n=1 Tax=Pomacea canaliculata TaxID=400727 RepID=UPI000D72C663|nr:uncharacterized protein LOC112566331 [Pomacea canaliculata]XP_025098236.1 uncharacterized protein LOC112566331 [Pomacea canaliculata]